MQTHIKKNILSTTLTNFHDILGNCIKMRQLYENIKKVASSKNTTVLILGESGTGKELVARAIHNSSPKANEAFIEINCSALPDNLLESELFGHEKGAFTDAKQSKKGLLELADGGTFFLDEIAELNIQLQAKLLKVLDEHTFRRVGGTKNINVTMRIMAATNKNLYELVQKELFREDLYYRLDVITIQIPPLRERQQDIILLAKHYINIANKIHNGNVKGFTAQAAELLMKYPWPGNVRELKNRIERAVLMNSSRYLKIEDLRLGAGHAIKNYPAKIEMSDKIEINIPPQGISFEEVEKTILKQVLKLSKGNKSKAARLLKMSRETLRYRIKKFNLENNIT